MAEILGERLIAEHLYNGGHIRKTTVSELDEKLSCASLRLDLPFRLEGSRDADSLELVDWLLAGVQVWSRWKQGAQLRLAEEIGGTPRRHGQDPSEIRHELVVLSGLELAQLGFRLPAVIEDEPLGARIRPRLSAHEETKQNDGEERGSNAHDAPLLRNSQLPPPVSSSSWW